MPSAFSASSFFVCFGRFETPGELNLSRLVAMIPEVAFRKKLYNQKAFFWQRRWAAFDRLALVDG